MPADKQGVSEECSASVKHSVIATVKIRVRVRVRVTVWVMVKISHC